MANRRYSVDKRAKELNRLEKREAKEARREARKALREEAGTPEQFPPHGPTLQNRLPPG